MDQRRPDAQIKRDGGHRAAGFRQACRDRRARLERRRDRPEVQLVGGVRQLSVHGRASDAAHLAGRLTLGESSETSQQNSRTGMDEAE